MEKLIKIKKYNLKGYFSATARTYYFFLYLFCFSKNASNIHFCTEIIMYYCYIYNVTFS